VSDTEYTDAQRAEPPLHHPRACPSCGQESRAVIAGQCLACRTGGDVATAPEEVLRRG